MASITWREERDEWEVRWSEWSVETDPTTGAQTLTPDDAHAAWLARGGPAESFPARMAWERSKLRAQLSRAGATGLDALYEIRRDGDTVRTRVRVF